MAYNLGTVRECVRNRLDDEDFEQEYLDRAINYAQWEITNNRHFTFLEDTEDLSVSVSDVEVDLPTNYRELLFLRLTSPAALRANLTQNFIPYTNFIETFISPADEQANQPYVWSLYGRKIKLSAPADQAYTLKLDFLRTAPELVEDDDVPDIPEEYRELLELGAYMRIAKREDDYDVRNAEERDYDRLLTSLVGAYGSDKGPGGMRRMRVR